MPEKVWIEEPGVADPAPELEARGAEVGHELGHGAHRDPAPISGQSRGRVMPCPPIRAGHCMCMASESR